MLSRAQTGERYSVCNAIEALLFKVVEGIEEHPS